MIAYVCKQKSCCATFNKDYEGRGRKTPLTMCYGKENPIIEKWKKV